MTKILLVEDDKSLREIYGVRLLAEGYDIVSAGDGEEALAMAIKDRPDLIVSDVMMPKISGFDMLDILRSTTETKNIKVIMMTALSSEEQRQRGVNLGADRYLVKSQVGIEDVVRTVHEVLADAPVAGHAPLVSTPPAAPSAPPAAATTAPAPAPVTPSPVPAVPTPSAPAVPPAPAAMPNPVASLAPSAPPAATPAAPIPVPVAPSAPAPAPAPEPTEPGPDSAATRLPNSVLPEPTAPFSTPRPGTLAGRVIQPLESNGAPAPDFANLINQELASETPPAFPSGNNVPAPEPTPAPAATDLQFEETPHPTAPAPAASNITLPPVPPAPSAGL